MPTPWRFFLLSQVDAAIPSANSLIRIDKPHGVAAAPDGFTSELPMEAELRWPWVDAALNLTSAKHLAEETATGGPQDLVVDPDAWVVALEELMEESGRACWSKFAPPVWAADMEREGHVRASCPQRQHRTMSLPLMATPLRSALFATL